MTLAPPAPAPARTGAVRREAARATAGQRAGAYLIDVAIVAAIGMAVWLASGSLVLTAITVIELWAAGWLWEGHSGSTPGNLVCGLRTVRKEADVTVGALRLLPRSIVLGLAHIVPILLPAGLAASGALDGLAGATVIDVRKARTQAAAAGGRLPNLEAHIAGAGASAPGIITAAPIDRSAAVQPGAQAGMHAAAQPSQPSQPDPTGAGTVPVFELSDGTVIRVTGPGYIGRAPRAPEAVPDAILVRLPDGARSLSRTHATFGIDDDRLWVQDLGSANGAAVRHLGGALTDLSPDRPYFLVSGDVLVLGGEAELAFRRVLDRRQRTRAEARTVADGETVVVPVESPAPVPAPAPDAAPAAAREAAPIAAPDPQPVTVAIALQFQDGSVVPVRGAGYIGRAPALPEGERPGAELITVPDRDRSVSRTHGRFGVAGEQTWFEDLGSGNGSSLRTPDGRTGPMTPHQRFGLEPGMVLQLGDCVIQVIAV